MRSHGAQPIPRGTARGLYHWVTLQPSEVINKEGAGTSYVSPTDDGQFLKEIRVDWCALVVFSKHNAFPLQFCVFEIEQQANSQAGDFQIVQHLAKFVIADAINDFCVNDDLLEADQVWNVFTDLDSFVDDVKYPLLLASDLLWAEFYDQSVLRTASQAAHGRACSELPSHSRQCGGLPL